MSFIARLKALFGAKVNQTLEEMEDPRAELDYSLTRLQTQLRQISDSLVEVSTARRQLEAQRNQVQKTIDKTEEQARQAVRAEREDLAARALERKAAKEIGKEAATHRFTNEEKRAIADLVYAYKRKGIRTSENEITRIAVNFVLQDNQESGKNGVLDRVLKALNT